MERIRNVTTAGGGEFLRVSAGIDPGEQCELGHWRAEANWLQAGIRGRGFADGIQHVANCGDSLGWRPRAEDLRARSEVSALGRATRSCIQPCSSHSQMAPASCSYVVVGIGLAPYAKRILSDFRRFGTGFPLVRSVSKFGQTGGCMPSFPARSLDRVAEAS
jgi:hypothetical protein